MEKQVERRGEGHLWERGVTHHIASSPGDQRAALQLALAHALPGAAESGLPLVETPGLGFGIVWLLLVEAARDSGGWEREARGSEGKEREGEKRAGSTASEEPECQRGDVGPEGTGSPLRLDGNGGGETARKVRFTELVCSFIFSHIHPMRMPILRSKLVKV